MSCVKTVEIEVSADIQTVVVTGQGGFSTTVPCPEGYHAISGGLKWTGLTHAPIQNFHMVGSHPTDDGTGWTVDYYMEAYDVTAYAICTECQS